MSVRQRRNIIWSLIFVVVLYIISPAGPTPLFAQDVDSVDAPKQTFMPSLASGSQIKTLTDDVLVYEDFESYVCTDGLCFTPVKAYVGSQLVVHGRHYILFVPWGWDVSYVGNETDWDYVAEKVWDD